jgi:hypothetical protein
MGWTEAPAWRPPVRAVPGWSTQSKAPWAAQRVPCAFQSLAPARAHRQFGQLPSPPMVSARRGGAWRRPQRPPAMRLPRQGHGPARPNMCPAQPGPPARRVLGGEQGCLPGAWPEGIRTKREHTSRRLDPREVVSAQAGSLPATVYMDIGGAPGGPSSGALDTASPALFERTEQPAVFLRNEVAASHSAPCWSTTAATWF